MNILNTYELKLYYFVWISTNFYALYRLWACQNEVMTKNNITSLSDLGEGWITSRYVDNSDIEWLTWKHYLQISFAYLLIQYFVSEVLRTMKSQLLIYWYITSSVTFICYQFGVQHLVLALAVPMIYASLVLLEQSKGLIWLTSILLLMFYNYLKRNPIFWNFFEENTKDEDVYMILFAFGWIELRCISFTMDRLTKMNTSKEIESNKYGDILNMFAYVMYLPVFYNGPHILYEDFEQCYKRKRQINEKLGMFATNITIFLIYMFLLELNFHYIYFLALKENIELIRGFSTMALCGSGLWMGLEFHMKYVISYGTSGVFAYLDNINPPPTPRCIARVHVYSEMWRHFDVGLYKFLIKYIYKPCLGVISRHSILPMCVNKLLASLSTFIFIILWHGTSKDILIWAALNYIGLTCESLAQVISRTSTYVAFKIRYLKTDAMEQRMAALLCAPLLAMSAVSNFYLFAGTNVGNLFVERLCYPSLKTFVVLIVSLYSCCQVSISLQDVPSRTFKTL